MCSAKNSYSIVVNSTTDILRFLNESILKNDDVDASSEVLKLELFIHHEINIQNGITENDLLNIERLTLEESIVNLLSLEKSIFLKVAQEIIENGVETYFSLTAFNKENKKITIHMQDPTNPNCLINFSSQQAGIKSFEQLYDFLSVHMKHKKNNFKEILK